MSQKWWHSRGKRKVSVKSVRRVSSTREEECDQYNWHLSRSSRAWLAFYALLALASRLRPLAKKKQEKMAPVPQTVSILSAVRINKVKKVHSREKVTKKTKGWWTLKHCPIGIGEPCSGQLLMLIFFAALMFKWLWVITYSVWRQRIRIMTSRLLSVTSRLTCWLIRVLQPSKN